MSYFTKFSPLSSLITLAACGAILAAIPINEAFAEPTSPSSYQNSCRNIKIVRGRTLQPSCRRVNGTFREASILIRGIENENGNLRYSRNARADSSYQNSCRNINVDGATLFASCRRANNTFNSTSILIRGIENQNGRLRYSR